ncbi:MAG: MnhB domain-containing protein [Deinococcales bacterium]
MSKGPDVFFRTLVTPIVFALLAVGFHFFLRGHNAPGGGFIAGLIVAAAALLARMARRRGLLRIRSDVLMPLGLLVALATGVAPMLAGRPFLTSAHGTLRLHGIGVFEWSSAMLFDLGVFLVVVGATVTIIDLLAEEGGLAELLERGGEGAVRRSDAEAEPAGRQEGEDG